MTEGWEDCRLLGPGWKRREVFRRSGISCGKTDTYYQSPTGEKFRSKVEMVKYLGSSVDLTLFDFKNGTLLAPEEVQTRKRKRSEGNNQEPKIKILKVPAPPDGMPVIAEDGTIILCCEGCRDWFSGVLFGKNPSTHWLCGDCKAERRAFVKEQNFYKSVGCGACAPCQLKEDCTACSVCLLRAQSPEFDTKLKCLKRRCCKIVKKKSNPPLEKDKNVTPKVKPKKLSLSKMNVKTPQIFMQSEISLTPDIVIQPHVNLEQLAQPKVSLPQVMVPQHSALPVNKSDVTAKPLSIAKPKKKKLKLPFERQSDSSSMLMAKLKKKQQLSSKLSGQKMAIKRQLSICRNNRKCGKCEACVQKVDCGRCDFCRDKPKFGGQNLKRQKCRWRQCLRYAMSDSDKEYEANGFSSEQRFCSESSVHIKQEVDSNGTCEEVLLTSLVPKDHPFPSSIDEVLIESNLAEADESTPVIMEIFSLGSYQAFSRLDVVLREFLKELNGISLPAHWEVLPLDSPNLQLVQRSKHSTMSDTVIHIQPGLYFQITVHDMYIPSSHEVYANHPCRLATVDNVVELICNLESYQLCTGLLKSSQRSPDCQILVHGDRCPQCSLRPCSTENYL
ncbi:methyl-CpG-binding domain protein 1-like isoform X3 [Pleurodeles waltl]|uniref:methyl-CpG-binding domain protein 1-like isoform X3 n=1 Tax=Pleurodeles waltl TaxID=8319 RepID=UPI003709A0A1